MSEASYVYILSGQKLIKSVKNGQFGNFNLLLSTQNVNVARFARNDKWDFFLWFLNTVVPTCEHVEHRSNEDGRHWAEAKA